MCLELYKDTKMWLFVDLKVFFCYYAIGKLMEIYIKFDFITLQINEREKKYYEKNSEQDSFCCACGCYGCKYNGCCTCDSVSGFHKR